MRNYQSNNSNLKMIYTALLVAVLSFGCATGRGVTTDGSLPSPELIAPPDKSRGYSDSRTIASHSLTARGYELLERGDLDGALRLLEQAVGINPSDGSGYYYLAEVWVAKGDYALAARFNKLASIYLRNDRSWSSRAASQKIRIQSAAGE